MLAPRMPLPPDGHVHSEWSWDAEYGSMEQTCARAVEIGLPAIAFTEHLDFTTWAIAPDDAPSGPDPAGQPAGPFTPPPMDVEGYLECLQRCREKFPDLRIICGVELGEAHWHAHQAAPLLAAGGFDRVLGSLHTLPSGQRLLEISHVYHERPAAEILREYLAEVIRLIEGSDAFSVLAHIDYAARYWPDDAGSYAPEAFEDEFRAALRALARTGRALEVNTQLPLHHQIVGWWRDVGGEAVTFGSDAHDPGRLAFGFSDAAAMVEAYGFRPGRDPHDFWWRRS